MDPVKNMQRRQQSNRFSLAPTLTIFGALLFVATAASSTVNGQAVAQQSPQTAPLAPSSVGQVQSQNDKNNKPEPLDEFNLFPQVIECTKEHEIPAPGKLAECEPTCANPRPACLKIFNVGLDFVPCFCKMPLVRHPKSKLCVKVSECN